MLKSVGYIGIFCNNNNNNIKVIEPKGLHQITKLHHSNWQQALGLILELDIKDL